MFDSVLDGRKSASQNVLSSPAGMVRRREYILRLEQGIAIRFFQTHGAHDETISYSLSHIFDRRVFTLVFVARILGLDGRANL